MKRLRPFLATFAGRLGRSTTYLSTGWRGRVLTVGFVVLTLLILVGVLRSNWGEIRNFDWQFRPAYLVWTIVCVIATFALTALTWHAIVARFLPQTTLRMNVKHWAYANFARRLPGPVWYIASRAALYEQHGIAKTQISLLSGLELVLILVSGAILSLLTAPFWVLPEVGPAQQGRIWLLLLLLPLSALLMHPALLNRLWRRLDTTDSPVRPLHWRDTLQGVGLYMSIWLAGTLAFFCIINIVSPTPLSSLPRLLGIWAVANTVSFAGSLAFTAVGVRDISLTLLLAPLISAQAALIVTILTRILWLVSEFLAGLLSIMLKIAPTNPKEVL